MSSSSRNETNAAKSRVPSTLKRKVGAGSSHSPTKRGSKDSVADNGKKTETDARPTKKARKSKGQSDGSGREVFQSWPEYFHSLFKVFKTINTVLAFVSSRKQLATTFPIIRTSVEALLKQPLELSVVAEIKALLPDLVIFSYIPKNDLRIHDESASKGKRAASPDFSSFARGARTASSGGREHILVLEFVDNLKGQRVNNAGSYNLPPTLTPAGVKKLIERRNERFEGAVNELMLAAKFEDPAALLQKAGREHIPIDPHRIPSESFKAVETTEVPSSKHRPTIEAVIRELQQELWYKGQIIENRIIDEKLGQTDTLLVPSLSANISRALQSSRNITQLYTHQVEAINSIRHLKNVVVSTNTASGKSVIYQVPILTFLEEDPSATAIFVYPTKALAQDQKASLERFVRACSGLEDVAIATYDGDTPQEARAGIRETASVIFTNFDMIHSSMLPYEDLWRRFLKNLKLFVVDELHYYSGLFGSHVAQIMRRFRRICTAIGNPRPLFVSCSATIANPGAHMERIFGIDSHDIEIITKDGAPTGRKNFLVWNPPLVDECDPTSGRRSSLTEATGLMKFLMKRGVRVILFCKIRKVCELAMKTIKADLSSEGRFDILEKTKPYRGGYSQQDRRRIEHDAFNGNLLGIIATNALELGVDIGVLDAVIMLGFPASIASFRQQAGRAGRRARDSLAIFVADTLPVDQHYVNHPEELFDTKLDELVIDLDNRMVLEAHLQCAGHEMPLSLEDDKYFGPLLREICEKQLRKDEDGWLTLTDQVSHSPQISTIPFETYFNSRGEGRQICCGRHNKGQSTRWFATIIEELEISRAIFEIYEGGVFLHQGQPYIVKEVSHDSKIAKLLQADVNWITTPRDFTNKVILDAVDVDTPLWEQESTGLWIDVPKHILDLLRNKRINVAESIHAAEHAFLNCFSLAQELNTECKAPEKEYKATASQRKRPARPAFMLIFYDAIGKSGGIAVKAFDNGLLLSLVLILQLLNPAWKVNNFLAEACGIIEACRCDHGCTHCVQSPACREGNEVSSKLGARLILQGLLGTRINPDEISPLSGIVALDTITDALPVRVIEGLRIERDVTTP
ncbi:P-loop containing nucleoside triphosphate hydrolase protein [Infundibulicybe gibba]|nr:P-loop containing nucleoside triphosphate hydrolase protein [Infundibulicybe gibba]